MLTSFVHTAAASRLPSAATVSLFYFVKAQPQVPGEVLKKAKRPPLRSVEVAAKGMHLFVSLPIVT